jgi:hypothetical protein
MIAAVMSPCLSMFRMTAIAAAAAATAQHRFHADMGADYAKNGNSQ